ncbi:AAA family ATPase [Marinithermus hydrothermalis]|uniref:Adenylate/guanylate cyclase n=1 Tax=Marinithermus hydrothermalis (strain DSM 14884 / JCM 11576 / T1) TaxID=869210 RepID=F2NQA9_MARHT|nr:AAA family ATPase [Marinithermus hydrothermalis]AEB11636.1 adenylate/guanylate cyclase [Marinithermus hydrothermalis DSM 14884]
MRCAHCGYRNPPEFRYCGLCGNPLSAASEQARRWATVLFFDLSRFTAYAQAHGLEETWSVVNQVLSATAQCVEQHGGSVEQFLGDGMLAVFGLHQSHEEDPHNALRAAACMVARNQALARAKDIPLIGRVGIATGMILAAPLGGQREAHQTVLGPPVNLAQRLTQAAPPGEIWVDETTASLVPEAQLEPLEPLTAKGFSIPVRTYRFSGWQRRDPALFGREQELAALRAAFAEVQQGHNRLVPVVGPMGSGKTRLIEAFCEDLGDATRVLWSPRLSLEAPLRLTLREFFQEILGPPEAWLDALPLPASLRPVLAFSLGLQAKPPLSGAQLEEALIEAWLHVLRTLAEEKPLVVVLEDLHAAPETVRQLTHRFAEGQWGRILLLATSRKDYWRTSLHVGPLPPEAGQAYLRHLRPNLSPEALEHIYRQSGGIPLVMRFLALMPQPASSLAAALQSRMDTLPVEARTALLAASVCGQHTWAGLLQQILKHDPRPALARLVAEGYLKRTQSLMPDEEQYSFTDPFYPVAALELVPLPQRTAWHRKIAEWLVKKGHPGWAQSAAHHYAKAGEHERAYRMLRVAAQRAAQSGMLSQAELFYRQALEIAPTDALRQAARRDLAQLALARGTPKQALEWAQTLPEPDRHYYVGLALSELRRDKEAREALALQAYLAARPNDLRAQLSLARLEPASLALSRTEALLPEVPEDSPLAAELLLVRGEALKQLHKMESARRTFEEGYARCLRLGQAYEAVKAALEISGLLWRQGHPAAAMTWSERALEQAQDLHPALVAVVHAVTGGLYLDQGNYEAARQQLEKARAMFEEARTSEEEARVYGVYLRYLIETGHLPEAVALGETVYARTRHPWAGALLALAHALKPDKRSEARFCELSQELVSQPHPDVQAFVHAALGIRAWQTEQDPRAYFRTALRWAHTGRNPYARYLTLCALALYLRPRDIARTRALAQYLLHHTAKTGFMGFHQVARILRAELELAEGRKVDHLLNFTASLPAIELWRRSLLVRLGQTVSPVPSRKLEGYGILGGWARYAWKEALRASKLLR